MKISYRSLGVVSGIVGMAAASLLAADAQKGKEIFEKKCAMCHAKDLKGNPAMAKMYKLDPSALNLLKKETQDKKDADLIATTTKGKGRMPAQEGKLSAEDIAGAVAYIRSASGGK